MASLDYSYLSPKRQKVLSGIQAGSEKRFNKYSSQTLQPSLARAGYSSRAIDKTVGEAADKWGQTFDEGVIGFGQDEIRQDERTEELSTANKNRLQYQSRSEMGAMDRLNRQIRAKKEADALEFARTKDLADKTARRNKRRGGIQLATAAIGAGVGAAYGGPAGAKTGLELGSGVGSILGEYS